MFLIICFPFLQLILHLHHLFAEIGKLLERQLFTNMCMLPIALIATAKIINYFGLSKKNRFLVRFFGVGCRGGGYSANERREIGSKVRRKYWIVLDWYRSGNEVVSRKKAERCRQEAGVRNQQVKSSIIWVASTISTKKAHCGMRFLSMNDE